MSIDQPVRFWRDDSTLELQYGPLNLRILARTGRTTDIRAAESAAEQALRALGELAPLRSLLSTPAVRLLMDDRWPRVVRLMVGATQAVGDPSLTPFAAVAGSIAQVAVEAGLAAGAGTIVVENGGDVALALAPGDHIRVGVAKSLHDRRPAHVLNVAAMSGIGGVCTSGLGGRSFTLGVAEAAVAIARDAGTADACATVLGNATSVADPLVRMMRAGDIDPASDIPHLMVTTGVGVLSDETVGRALAQVELVAEALVAKGLLLGAIVRVQGREMAFPSGFVASLERSED